MTDLVEIDRITIAEYDLRLEAFQLRKLDSMNRDKMLAWDMQQVKATTKGKKPKPIYKSFDEFFDHDKLTRELRIRYEANFSDEQLSAKRSQIEFGREAEARAAEYRRLNQKGGN